MKSFNGSHQAYEEWGKQLKYHAERDELIQGTGWDNGKGCFIGCSIHDYSHQKFAKLFDVPEAIPRLADMLFENTDEAEAREFALAIWESMQVAVDYSKFTHYWHHWLVSDPKEGVIRFNDHPHVNAVGLLHLKAQTELVTQEEWAEAETQAYTVYTEARAAAACSAEARAAVCSAAACSAETFATACSAARAARAGNDGTYSTVAAVARKRAGLQQRIKFLELLASPVFPKAS